MWASGIGAVWLKLMCFNWVEVKNEIQWARCVDFSIYCRKLCLEINGTSSLWMSFNSVQLSIYCLLVAVWGIFENGEGKECPDLELIGGISANLSLEWIKPSKCKTREGRGKWKKHTAGLWTVNIGILKQIWIKRSINWVFTFLTESKFLFRALDRQNPEKPQFFVLAWAPMYN